MRFKILFVLFAFKFCVGLEPEVKIKQATIRGVEYTINGKDVSVFLGIPYAKPPIGELRFKRPQPITMKSSDILIAKNWPNSCMQMESKADYTKFFYSKQSEDCLYLNIWTPMKLSALETRLLPVMVFLYGGAFVTGSSSFELYNASNIATKGDVVVVTLNYRLGILGFLCADNDNIPGNMGLFDQALAFEWVKDNIKYFGGDSDRITIFGQSAGAISISAHILSPISKNLFNNAIIMSGVICDYFTVEHKSLALQKAYLVAKAFGCIDNEEQIISQSVVECLQSIDAKKLVNLQSNFDIIEIGMNPFRVAFGPVFGDSFFPHSPLSLLKTSRFKQNSRIMIGALPNEGITTLHVIKNFKSSKIHLKCEKKEDCKQLAVNYFRTCIHKNLTLDVDDILKFYFTSADDKNAKRTLFTLLGDLFFHCPSNFFARQLSKSNTVIQYVFNHSSSKLPINGCDGFSPCHANDLFYTFGKLLGDANDIKVSNKWIEVLTNFTKGNNWQPYSFTSNDHIIPFYIDFKPPNYEQNLKIGFRHKFCEFWKSMVFKEF